MIYPNSKVLLEVRGLCASVNSVEILKDLDFTVRSGEVHAIMGQNGSGKSTFAKVLAGHPAYEVTSGSVLFEGQNLLALKPEERARAGFFLAFQYPIEIPGVVNSQFLRLTYNTVQKQRGKEELDPLEFDDFVREKMKLLRHAAKTTTSTANDPLAFRIASLSTDSASRRPASCRGVVHETRLEGVERAPLAVDVHAQDRHVDRRLAAVAHEVEPSGRALQIDALAVGERAVRVEDVRRSDVDRRSRREEPRERARDVRPRRCALPDSVDAVREKVERVVRGVGRNNARDLVGEGPRARLAPRYPLDPPSRRAIIVRRLSSSSTTSTTRVAAFGDMPSVSLAERDRAGVRPARSRERSTRAFPAPRVAARDASRTSEATSRGGPTCSERRRSWGRRRRIPKVPRVKTKHRERLAPCRVERALVTVDLRFWPERKPLRARRYRRRSIERRQHAREHRR